MIVESVAVSAVAPVAFTIQMNEIGKLSREEFQLELEKAMKEARKAMQRDLKIQETIKAARKSKARNEKFRLVTIRSA